MHQFLFKMSSINKIQLKLNQRPKSNPESDLSQNNVTTDLSHKMCDRTVPSVKGFDIIDVVVCFVTYTDVEYKQI